MLLKVDHSTLGTGRDQKKAAMRWLALHGAHLHNLQNVRRRRPLAPGGRHRRVSGSGKSTLARDVLLANVQALVTQRASQGRPRRHGRRRVPTGSAAPA
jgi:excinuclease ABC subunit A